MNTVLILTVGGADAPIKSAIKAYQPNFVYFLCSTGKQGSDATARQVAHDSALGTDSFELVIIEELDSLNACYAVSRNAMRRAMEVYEEAHIIADYTGGTKSMTVGLALAAVELGCELSLVRGTRTDLTRVVDGTEIAGLVNTWEMRAQKMLTEATRFFNRYFYAAALTILEGMAREQPLSREMHQLVQNHVVLCRAFESWDRFDHGHAFELLQVYPDKPQPQFTFLLKVLGKGKCSGYELVWDLLGNASRRAEQGRYDDAVARLYRALEMFAQTRLRQREPSLASGNIDVAQLPEELQGKYEGLRSDDGKVKLGLRQDYELLAELADPTGEVYAEYANRLLNALGKRNESILAHGDTPLTRSDFDGMYTLVKDFMQQVASKLKVRVELVQFPQLGDT